MGNYYVYIISNRKHGTIYIGVINDLLRRIAQHKVGEIPGFSKRYQLDKLVYFEYHNDIRYAITREKRLKRWCRKWKVELIENNNPDWKDLYEILVNDK